MKKEAPTSAPVDRTGQKLVSAVPWTFVTRLTTFVAMIAVSTLAYRHLGKEGWGLLSVLRTLALYFVLLAAFGLDASFLRFLPLLRERGASGEVVRFVSRTFRAQVVLVVVLWAALVGTSGWLWELFEVGKIGVDPETFRWYVVLAGGLGAAMVAFQANQHVCLATFWTKAVTGATLVRGFFWCGGVAVAVALGAGAGVVLGMEMLAFGAGAVVLGLLALRTLRADAGRAEAARAPEAAPADSQAIVPFRRQLTYGATLVASGLINLVVQRQSEVFFLARYSGFDVAGHYDLVHQYPQMALEFLPLAASAVVMSAFAEVHARDPAVLHAAMRRYHRTLILLLVPLAVLGMCWADRLLILIFGESIAADAHWANVFSFIHAVPGVYLPLSAALLTLEKAHLMLPFGVLQVVINLGLDFLLIPPYGLPGAVAAVGVNLVLTVPLQLYVGARVTKGLAYPLGVLARTLLFCSPALLPLPLRWVLPGNWGTLVGVPLSVALVTFSLSRSGLVGDSEREILARIGRRIRGRS